MLSKVSEERLPSQTLGDGAIPEGLAVKWGCSPGESYRVSLWLPHFEDQRQGAGNRGAMKKLK